MLQEKVVIVTGAGRGIGRAIALLCASQGARVVVNDLGVDPAGHGADASPAEAVVQEILAQGGAAVANAGSVATETGAASIVQTAIDAFGRIDAVVNNAGFLRDAMFHKLAPKDWADVLDVHLNGAFLVSRAAAPYFRAQQSGAFVHFTSTTALLGNRGQANYAAAKSGVLGLSYAIALDMERFGVRSNCIAPTAGTRLVGTVAPESEADLMRLESVRAMTPDKIAPLVAYLCTDNAAPITGQTFGVRKDEIFLYSRPRILRTLHNSHGWTLDSLDAQLMPAFRGSFEPLQTTPDAIAWEPL